MLYAIALAWPDSGKLVIKSLAAGANQMHAKDVSLLGYSGKLEWKQTRVVSR